MAEEIGTSLPAARADAAANDLAGTTVGRFVISARLGAGGMGQVYGAEDTTLKRFVAIKRMGPHVDSAETDRKRLLKEAQRSSALNHPNVGAIYDVVEHAGELWLVMEYVAGQTLRHRLTEPISTDEFFSIAIQCCEGLQAAHEKGIIHGDIKPENIMIADGNRVKILDFGVARRAWNSNPDDVTKSMETMTVSGGTPAYMAPEVLLQRPDDGRSDIFSLGLVFYEMLGGKQPFQSSSLATTVAKIVHEEPPSLKNVPGPLADVISRTLAKDPDARYPNAAALRDDLHSVQQGEKPKHDPSSPGLLLEDREAAALGFYAAVKPWGQTIPWPLLTGMASVIVLAIVGYIFRASLFSPAAAPSGPVQSLAILPFRNASGDSSLDWLGSSFADMLSTDIGQSAQLRTVSPSNLHQILTDLRISSSTELDPSTIRRVADFSNAQRMIWGQYAKFGDQIRIDATLQDFKNDRSVPLKIEIPNEKEIPGAIDKLAESIREKLSLPSDVLKELKASAFQPESASVEALRAYNLGVGFQRDGRNLDAQQQLETATKADPNFALAFSRLAQTYSKLGYDDQAEQTAQKAVTLCQNLPEAEKYLITAMRSLVVKNYADAIKAFETLAKTAPDNYDVQVALASLYQDSGDLAKAREYYQKILSANPKDVAATLNLGRIEIKSGNPQTSFDPLNRAYSLSVQVGNEEQKATGLHLMAVAYRMLNKPDEVVRNETEALAIWRAIGQKSGLAFSLNEMAKAKAGLGKNKEALADFQEALQIRREIGDKRGLGDTLIEMGNFADDAGDHDQSLKLEKDALEMEREVGNESLQAVCLNNIGTSYSEKGQYEDALIYYQQALQLREKSKAPQDIVEAVHNLGDTSVDMGQYDKALAYYLRALDLRRSMDDQRGAAIESNSLGLLFDYQGRFGAAIKSQQDALKTFRDMKDRSIFMARILNATAEALILAGRGDEATSNLDESLKLSRELKNDSVMAQTLGVQGDAFFYHGNSSPLKRPTWKRCRQPSAAKNPIPF